MLKKMLMMAEMIHKTLSVWGGWHEHATVDDVVVTSDDDGKDDGEDRGEAPNSQYIVLYLRRMTMLCSSLIMILLLLMMMMATMVMVETVARLMIPNTSSRSYWCIGLPQSSPIAQHIISPYFYYFFYFYYFSNIF